MLFLSRLRTALHSADGDGSAHLLSAAALLLLVARSDGLLKEAEEEELRAGLSARFALSDWDAEGLLARAAALDGDSASLAADVLRDLSPEERPVLLLEAYRIAAADGQVDEVEDDLVWRIGRLLGFDEAEIGRIRADALAES